MTIESADDNALNDVFSSDRDRTGAEPVSAPDTGSPNRDDRGRFAGKSQDAPVEPQLSPAAPQADAQTAVDPNTGRQVPLSELLTERKQRQEIAKLHTEAEARAKAYEQQIDRLMQFQQRPAQPPQAQQPPPDFLSDPEGALQHHLSRQEQIYNNRLLNQSEVMARDKFGDEIVNAALQAAQQAGTVGQFQNAPHPWGELVKWHKRQQTLQRVGEDPDAYEARVRKEEREKVLAELKAGGANGQQAAPKFPGSLASATAQGAQGASLTPEAAMGSVFASDRNRRHG